MVNIYWPVNLPEFSKVGNSAIFFYTSYFYLLWTQAFISYTYYKYILFGGFLSTLLMVSLEEK